jgi:hypothetical protein
MRPRTLLRARALDRIELDQTTCITAGVGLRAADAAAPGPTAGRQPWTDLEMIKAQEGAVAAF